jgi:hypothetical protein
MPGRSATGTTRTSPPPKLAQHWDVTSWMQLPFPQAALPANQVVSLTAVPQTGELWAAGVHGTTLARWTMLILHHS